MVSEAFTAQIHAARAVPPVLPLDRIQLQGRPGRSAKQREAARSSAKTKRADVSPPRLGVSSPTQFMAKSALKTGHEAVTSDAW